MSTKKADFIPYPEFEDPDFYKKIYSKKEFHKTKIAKSFLDQKIEEVCDPDQFNLQSYQEFLRNYISTSTHYNGLLAFWGVGTGKCVLPETDVYVDGDLMQIEQIWEKYNSGISRTDKDGGQWSDPSKKLTINTYDETSGKLFEYPINQLYKQTITEKINVLELDNGQTIKMTKNHHLLTEKGWSNDFDKCQYIAIPRILKNTKNQKSIGKDLAYFLGWQISEGHECDDQYCLLVTNTDLNVLNNLMTSIKAIAHEHNLNINNPNIIHSVERAPHLQLYSKDYVEFLERNEYEWGHLSAGKSIPKIIMNAPVDELRTFLQAYFDAESHVDKKNCTIEISTASYKIIVQLQHLLKLFGIDMIYKLTQKMATNGKRIYRDYYVGYIRSEDLRKYQMDIGYTLQYKKDDLDFICSKKVNPNKCRFNLNGLIKEIKQSTHLPNEVFVNKDYIYKSTEPSRTSVYKIINNLENIITGQYDLPKRNSSKYVLDIKYLRSKIMQLKFAIESEMMFVKINKYTEEDYTGPVYDLEVNCHHNYIANGIICHNTCAAIQVAEGLKETVKKLGRKIYIIAKKQVRPNFWKELYSTKREKQETIPGSKQCTGSTYHIPKSEEKDEARRERKIRSKIKQYYEFYGIQSFANYVDFNVKKEYPDVGDFFSNSVIIVDEAHGLTGEAKSKTQSKKTGEKTGKQKKVSERGILTVLQEILKESTGIKLILLTATPMKNEAPDLVDLLNLLLINDKRPVVDKKKLFPNENDVNETYLAELAKGYVSYIRGENPVTFPQIVEPNPTDLDLPPPQMYTPAPIYSETGELLDKNDLMEKMTLIRCPMSIYQYSNYINIVGKTTSKTSKKAESIDLVGRQSSNIIFPTSSNPNVGQYGNEGFKHAFDEYTDPSPAIAYGKTKTGNALFKKKSIQYKYKDFNEGFLSLSKIGKYSKKLETYLKNVIKSKGILYTYSDFVDGGAKIIALLLEENGFVRYKPQTKLSAQDLLYKDGKTKQYRCAICGTFKDNVVHQPTNKKFHKFIQATYVLFTGDESKYSKEEIDIVNSDDNIDGQLIKIIVGTRVSGEGIDYRRIREVHIIDPWHNNTRLYQVIGRAARHCSHKDLPADERKVTVYKYCSAPPQLYYDYINQLPNLIGKGLMQSNIPLTNQNGLSLTYQDIFTETSDEKVYRRIEKKDIFVKRIERILKMVAIDCALNKNANIFPTDVDDTRQCDYMKCDYTCAGDVEKIDDSKMEVNLDTYNLHFSEPQINRAQKIIYDLFKFNFVMDLSNIIKLIQERQKDIEIEYINEALDRIVGNPPYRPPIELVDRFNRYGHVIFAKPYYIFQPHDLDDNKAPLYYRITPLTIKKHFLNLEALKSETLAHLPQIQKQLGEQMGKKEVSININETINDLVKTGNKYQINAKLDRLTPDIQETIFEEVIYSKKYPQSFQNILIDYFNNLDKLYAYMSMGEKPKYLAHKINFNIRLYDEKIEKWITVDESHHKITAMASTMKALQSAKPIREPSKLHGYVKYNPKKQDYEFKLVDYDKQSLKLTKPSITKKGAKPNISKKSKITGKVCKNFARKDLVNYANTLAISGVTSGTKKETLCDLIELKFRELDDKDGESRWFYNMAESLNL